MCETMVKKEAKKECMNADCSKPRKNGSLHCEDHTVEVSVNGQTYSEIDSPEAKEQIGDVVKKHVQQDLEGKVAEFPIKMESEDYTVLEFTSGAWTLKVREDKLEEAYNDAEIETLAQRRLKGDASVYPLMPGEFDRWVERFVKALRAYAGAHF